MAEFESCSKCKYDYRKGYEYPCNQCEHGVNPKDFYEPKTNADRIRAMSDEELAEFLIDHHRYPCKYCSGCPLECSDGLMQWLKSEVKE